MTRLAKLLPSVFSMAVALGWVSVRAAEPLTIVVDPGRLGSIAQAAVAEAKVNWWDDELADDAACTESYAAMELQRFLALALHVPASEIALATPAQLPAKGRVILVGSAGETWLARALPAAAAPTFAPAAAESFHLRDFDDGGRTVTVILGRDRVGALYGVYAYLEKLGVKFYGLGEKGTVLPSEPTKLPAGVDAAESPDYLTRGFWAFEKRGDPEFFAWMARNRLNFWTVAPGLDHVLLKKLGMRLTGGWHNIQFTCLNPAAEYPYRHAKFDPTSSKPADPYAVSPDYRGDANHDGKLSYFEAHPEWYGLRDGKRSDHLTPEVGDNYCTSNADATRELTKHLVEECIAGEWREADIINFWMLDNGKWCTCDACQKQGIYTDRLMAVIDATLKALQQARREGRLKRRVQVVSLAYHETLPAPQKPLPADFDYDDCAMTFFPIERCFAHSFADPSCTEINADLLTKYEGWTKGPGRNYTGSIFIGEYYNVSSFKSLPLVFTHVMAADIPWYFQNGARHFHYMHTLTQNWGTWTVNQALMARLLWNTHANADQFLEDYFRLYYPTTAAVTRQFYAELETASANSKALKHYVGTPAGQFTLRARLSKDKLPLFSLEHLHYEPYHPLLNDAPDLVEIADAVNHARIEIDRALLTCTDATERSRLQEDEHRFAYGEAIYQLYFHLIRTAMFHRQGQKADAARELAVVRELGAKLRTMVDVVQFAGLHASATDGYEASQAEQYIEYFQKIDGTPAAKSAPPAAP